MVRRKRFEVLREEEEVVGEEEEIWSGEDEEPVSGEDIEVLRNDDVEVVVDRESIEQMLRYIEEKEQEYTRLFTDMPLDKKRIINFMIRLKSTLYAVIKTLMWIEEETRRAHGLERRYYKDYKRELRKEFRYDVCRAHWLAHKALDYYICKKDMSGIEELVELAKTVKPKYDITRCRDYQPDNPPLVIEALRKSGNIEYLENSELQEKIHRHFHIQQLLRIPRDKEWF